MNKKLKIYLLFLLVINSFTAYCKSDFEIAKEFMFSKGVILSEQVTTRSVSTPYSAFRAINDKGYVVVENGVVIAYSLEEPLEKFRMRPSSSRQFTLTPKSPISPMIEAKFDQTAKPYRDSLPLMNPYYGTYVLSPVGCGALAVAKIMYYYKNEGCEAIDEQDFGEKYPKLEALPETKFDWDNILPEYIEGEYTIEQRIEVAKLMKYVGYAVETEYSAFSSGSWVEPKSLLKLGFSKYTYSSVRSDYKVGSSEWWKDYDTYYAMADFELERLLDKELEQGRPVMLAGYDKYNTLGHWCVIDGRDDTGRYHVDDMGYMILSQQMLMEQEVPQEDILWCLNLVWCVVPIMQSTVTHVTPTIETPKNNEMYNLKGQHIKIPGKGVYINSGKKYISK